MLPTSRNLSGGLSAAVLSPQSFGDTAPCPHSAGGGGQGLSRAPRSPPYLQLPLLCAGVEFKVLNADGCDHMSLPPRVTGAMGEDDLVVTLARP